jgi:hypothetical protein
MPDPRPEKRRREAENPMSKWSKENEERALSGLVAALSGKAGAP